MSESSNTPAEEGQPFDVEKFARDTVFSVEFHGAHYDVLEERVIRLEEIVAARWPRRWLLRRRLAREIRASAATWPDEYIPRGDFAGRRSEWADFTASARYDRRAWKPEFGSVGQGGNQAAEAGSERPAEDGTDPGEGFLP